MTLKALLVYVIVEYPRYLWEYSIRQLIRQAMLYCQNVGQLRNMFIK